MKFIDKLLGRKEVEPAGRKARPAGQRPAPRKRTAVPETPPASSAQKEKNPFLDSDFAGLEIANDAKDSADPYSTNSWEYDRNDEARRLKAKEHGIVRLEDPPENFNPYDTGVFRGAWKD